jgi:hypothetical protein
MHDKMPCSMRIGRRRLRAREIDRSECNGLEHALELAVCSCIKIHSPKRHGRACRLIESFPGLVAGGCKRERGGSQFPPRCWRPPRGRYISRACESPRTAHPRKRCPLSPDDMCSIPAIPRARSVPSFHRENLLAPWTAASFCCQALGFLTKRRASAWPDRSGAGRRAGARVGRGVRGVGRRKLICWV